MPQCPICNAEIKDDFGLVECGECGAPLIVHVDGRVEHSVSQSAGDVTPEPEVNVNPVFNSDLDEDLPQEEEMMEEAPSEPSAMSDFAEPDGDFTAQLTMGDAEPEEMFSDSPPPIASNSPDLADVVEFANSEESGRNVGPLRYDVTISGIDTVDVREAFREAITDRKLMWDTDEIIRSIHNGEVRIENVSAVKAHVLISRLRLLPVDLAWEQYSVHQG